MTRAQAGFTNLRRMFYNRVIEFYGRTLKFVLRHQTATLLVTVGTLVLTLLSVCRRAEGLLPRAGYRSTSRYFGSAAEHFVSRRCRTVSSNWREVILKDPDVESLSSFIGVDGTNTTLNSGRIQINLKPRDERKPPRRKSSGGLQPKLAHRLQGITLYMQPVQDFTVEDRVSRTQYQYSMEDADAQELATWSQRLVEKLRRSPQIARCGQRSAKQAA